nr:hypothetical protein GCM10010200_090480 [Actinomadura rugatobispora]
MATAWTWPPHYNRAAAPRNAPYTPSPYRRRALRAVPQALYTAHTAVDGRLSAAHVGFASAVFPHERVHVIP